MKDLDEYTPCKKPDPTARKKQNKYHARKTTVCGRTFDSKREADYYLELLARKQAGEIVRIGFQPSYTLLAGFKDNTGKNQKPIDYLHSGFLRDVCGRAF